MANSPRGRWTGEEIVRPPLPANAPAGEAAAVWPARRGPRTHLRAVVATVRPRQWIKNGLIIAAGGAAGAIGHDDVPVRLATTFVAFCLLSAGVYAINDVRDAAEDRRHPRKRFRPVAAGVLDPRSAVGLGVGCMVGGLVLCAVVRPLLVAVGAGYLALTISYSLVWRHIVWLDILAIAGGFVLRALAGGVAPPVGLSRWFVLVVTCAAIAVAAGKRLAELRRTDAFGGASGRRRALERYTLKRLSLLLLASGLGTLVAYLMWAFELPSVHGVPWRPLTVLPLALCMLRYGVLIRSGEGEAPEELLLGDRWMLLAGAAWLIVFGLGVHAAG